MVASTAGRSPLARRQVPCDPDDVFRNRRAAGERLADVLEPRPGRDGLIVVGLPRGGVPVAAVVAERLGVPLDVIMVRKLGVPAQPELAMGAIGEGGVRVVADEIVAASHVTAEQVEAAIQREQRLLDERAERYRSGRSPTSLAGRSVIVIDDGIATGATARAACEVARASGAVRVVLAVPVAPPGWDDALGSVADEYVSVETPEWFTSVGSSYDDFAATTDDEVVAALVLASR